ncbi:MAG TPA: hypothetical protein VFK92_02390 [Burkholderiales bacterium]|nr:hypothetical protein [Burkholderiales bacterium]
MSTTSRVAAGSTMLLAALALASCGGGGSGSAGPMAGGGGGNPVVPTALLALNATNAVNVASRATLTGLGASSLGNQFQNALATAPLLPRTHLLPTFLRQQIDRLTQNLQSLPQPSIINAAVTTSPCAVSGSVTFDQGAASATETFSACSETAGSSVMGTITIDNMTLDPGVSFSGSAGLNLTFSQTGSPDVTLTGSNVGVLETVNVAVNTVTLTGAALFAATATNTERLANYTLVAAIDPSSETDTVTFNYASTLIGGSVDVSTTTPCVTDTANNRNFPHAGALSLSGAAGSRIQVTVNGDETFTTSSQVTLGVDANGDGTFESTSSKNWADLSV